MSCAPDYVSVVVGSSSYADEDEDMFVAEPSNRRTRVYGGPLLNAVERRLREARKTAAAGRKGQLRRVAKGAAIGPAVAEVKQMVNSIDRR